MPQSLERVFNPTGWTIDRLIGAFTPGNTREKRWIRNQIKEIGIPWLENLAHSAAIARRRAYTPYSHYDVGAATLDINGNISDGQNIEIVSYTDTEHAEEMAVKKGVSNGAVQKMGRTFVRAVAVSHEGDTSPCGRCRQIIAEFADNALIIVADPKGNIRRITSLQILLPHAFTPKSLGIK